MWSNWGREFVVGLQITRWANCLATILAEMGGVLFLPLPYDSICICAATNSDSVFEILRRIRWG